jgi:hypothetical protein
VRRFGARLPVGRFARRTRKTLREALGARERRHGRLWRGMGGEEAVAHSYRASRHQTAGEADASARLSQAFFEQSSRGASATGPWVAPEAEFQQVLGRPSPLASPPRCVK